MKPISFAEEGKLGRSPVPHLMQELNWDCGLACVGMVLRALGAYSVTLPSLKKQVASSTVWTIDLCYLLAHHAPDADFTFYTSFLGANPEHVRAAQYYSDVTPNDLLRVDRMFTLARRHAISIIRMVFPLEDFKRFLLHRAFAIIVLVNAEMLFCECCSTSNSSKLCRVPSLGAFSKAFSWRACCSSPSSIEYAGHYIVLIGYEPSSDCFIYRDPAARAYFCMIPSSKFEVARRFPGTDDDCVVIKL